jgi:leucyl/phenylalanyl-tRNA---protein transferase
MVAPISTMRLFDGHGSDNTMIRIAILAPGSSQPFPAVETALDEPNGLLAAGGDLSPARLIDAYRHGIFPWFSHGDPILWWSPDPRMVFDTGNVHISTRLRRWLRNCRWTIAADLDFNGVIQACAKPRPTQPTTWITQEMMDAYNALHALGYAHSIEVYEEARLVGGIYGVAVGRMFFGESMFSAQTNGSKVALIALCAGLRRWGFPLVDAQVVSAHLESMGAKELPRSQFIPAISSLCAEEGRIGSWSYDWTIGTAASLA